MRLVSIRLANVRRFDAPVRVAGFGPGLNVLTAPNEQGKSTLFDALMALFFAPHRSRAQEVAALKPHAGGAPEVSVEVDLPDGRYRIAKRWLSRPMATVHRGGAVVAQADEAEAWIARLMRAEAAGGPAGLLWVRQGMTGLDAGGDRERRAAEAARRDLMSSVTGEIEALTGGRRMDRVQARVRDELALYLTPTGRAKAGGLLAEAEDAVAELAARKAELEAQVQALGTAILRRQEVRKALAELDDPAAVAERARRLAEATERHEAASRHAEAIAAAKTALEIAALRDGQAADRLAAFRRDRGALAAATTARAAAEAAAAGARAALGPAEAELAERTAALDAARARETEATARLSAAQRAEAARIAAGRREDLEARLARARELLAERAARAPAAAAGPDAAALEKLEELARAADLARELRARGAARFELRHAGERRARMLGHDLPEVAASPVLSEMRIELPGLGDLTLWPAEAGDGAGADRLAAAQAALARALAAAGAPDLAAARRLAQARAEAAADLRRIDAELALIAPKGVAALEAEIAALPAPPDPGADAPPDAAGAEAAAAAAARARAAAEAARDAARERATALRTELARLEAELAAAERERAARAAALAAHGEAASAEAALTRAAAQCAADREAARAKLAALEAAAPDLAAAAAALARARSVAQSAAVESQRLREELAGLDREIGLRAGEGAAEELADVTDRLRAAEDRLRRVRFEVEVLKLLAATLDEARAAARDRYFEPVLRELRPLLRLLWPDAEIRFDDRSLLPAELIRGGTVEPVEVLSGGTREQVALLVRLAFARLLAKGGRPTPVILDDALVFSDDDRIEAMFDALTRQAEDLQVLVLSCRQRAFRALGGTRLGFEAAADP
jgi:hypothetical protein